MKSKKILKKYTNKKINPIKLKDLNKYANDISPVWIEALTSGDFETMKIKVLELWVEVVGRELSLSIKYMKNNLISLDVIQHGNNFSLIYGINSVNGDVIYYEGIINKEIKIHENLIDNWDSIPTKIRKFYDNLHDGFYHFASHSMGLYKAYEIVHLGGYDWEFFEENDLTYDNNIDTSYGFFGNGMGTYIVIDVENESANKAILWSSREVPNYNLNFWDYVDSWMLIGFEDDF